MFWLNVSCSRSSLLAPDRLHFIQWDTTPSPARKALAMASSRKKFLRFSLPFIAIAAVGISSLSEIARPHTEYNAENPLQPTKIETAPPPHHPHPKPPHHTPPAKGLHTKPVKPQHKKPHSPWQRENPPLWPLWP